MAVQQQQKRHFYLACSVQSFSIQPEINLLFTFLSVDISRVNGQLHPVIWPRNTQEYMVFLCLGFQPINTQEYMVFLCLGFQPIKSCYNFKSEITEILSEIIKYDILISVMYNCLNLRSITRRHNLVPSANKTNSHDLTEILLKVPFVYIKCRTMIQYFVPCSYIYVCIV